MAWSYGRRMRLGSFEPEPGDSLHVDRLEKLVSFPSIHPGGSILLFYLFRGSRIWPVVAVLSILTITAVAVIGGDYIVVAIAGVLSAVAGDGWEIDAVSGRWVRNPGAAAGSPLRRARIVTANNCTAAGGEAVKFPAFKRFTR